MTASQLLRLLLIASLLVCSTAQAQLFRAYLASDGNDANPCTVQAPCRLLSTALSAVKDGGEIWMLDSANYNIAPVIIDKSVSILAIPGALGSVISDGGDAFTINAPSSKVKLRNLTIRPLSGSSGNGIHVTAVGSLLVDNVTAESLSVALYLAGSAIVNVKESVLRANSYGILVEQPEGAQIVLSVDHSSIIDNPQSIIVWMNSTTGFHRLTVDNSVITGTGGGNGAVAIGGGVASAGPVRVTLVRTKVVGRGPAGAGTGVSAFGAQTVVTLSDCHISGFYYGARTLNGPSGVGVLRSLGNNVFDDNTSNGSFSAVAPL
jgi:hypothetical protein